MSGWFRGDCPAESPLNLLHMYTAHSLTPAVVSCRAKGQPWMSLLVWLQMGPETLDFTDLWGGISPPSSGLKILWLFWPLDDHDRKETTFPTLKSYFLSLLYFTFLSFYELVSLYIFNYYHQFQYIQVRLHRGDFVSVMLTPFHFYPLANGYKTQTQQYWSI